MARSIDTFTVPEPQRVAFDFIADFTHATLFDPRTRHVDKVTAGPIGKGTRFDLVGAFAGFELHLPYTIAEYEPSERIVFVGRTWFLSYRETVTFRPDSGGTQMTWDASAELHSVLWLGNPILSLIYPMIGKDATRNIASAMRRAIHVDGKSQAAAP